VSLNERVRFEREKSSVVNTFDLAAGANTAFMLAAELSSDGESIAAMIGAFC